VPWACARSRVLSAADSLALDNGADGAVLFDIVNVDKWTRRRPRRIRQARFRIGNGAAILCQFSEAGLAHRAEHSPRKREAGGSSPPASTICTRGETADAAASEAAAITGVEVQVLPGAPTKARFAKWKGIGPTHRHSQVRILERAPSLSRSSMAEHPADNRKTADRYRAGEPTNRRSS
jgi:hypothetical protein